MAKDISSKLPSGKPGTSTYAYMLVHMIVTAGVFLVGKLGFTNTTNLYASYFFGGLDYWVAASLIAMAYVIVKRPFTTPHVIDAKCFKCGGTMAADKLKCQTCGAVFG